MDLELLAHDARGKLGAVASVSRMLADGLAGPVTPVQREFCERLEDLGLQLAPLVTELARRARRPTA